MKRPTNGTVGFGVLLLGIVILIVVALPPRSESPTTVTASTPPAREPTLAAGIPPPQSLQSQAPRTTASNRFDELRQVWKPAPERTSAAPDHDPFETVRATKENIRTMIGRHLWAGPSFEGYRFMRYCPPRGTESCSNYPSPGKVGDDTGFTVVGISEPPTGAYAYLADDQIYVKVRLDDGRAGYDRLDDAFWYTQDPQLRKRAVHERVTRTLADCQRRPSIAIGMTEPEVLASKWGQLLVGRVNTTETAGHTREQWVYDAGPECNEDGTPGMGAGRRGYLYFDNGRLVAIQR
jgi:hypothetical protein